MAKNTPDKQGKDSPPTPTDREIKRIRITEVEKTGKDGKPDKEVTKDVVTTVKKTDTGDK
jgi:hypothetical protein